MRNVIDIPSNSLSVVSRASVQVSKYSEENGGADRATGTVFAVETLFPDGTWVNEGYYRLLAVAKVKARRIADARGAVVLVDSIWPNRKIGGTQ